MIDLPKPISFEILMIHDNLDRYAVFWNETGDSNEPMECFICFAEAKDHAIEQCVDADPSAVVAFVTIEI